MQQVFTLKPVKNNPKLDHFFSHIEKEFFNFFGIEIDKPLIFFLRSRKDIDKIWGKKTESWFCAWVKKGNIYILDPAVYTKESDHKIEHFWSTIKHEVCHLYFNQLTGINYPKWLNEGLACYLAGQVKKTPSPDERIKVSNYFKKSDGKIYAIGFFWIKLLIEKFGRKKFIELLKLMKPELTEQGFKNIFFTVYKIKFTKTNLNELSLHKDQ